MSIETTFNVRRQDAVAMLKERGVYVYDNDCAERLSDMLYDQRREDGHEMFENYHVVDDNDHTQDTWEYWKEHWYW